MTIEEARFELTRSGVRQKQIEREVLAILNRGCLPLEEAKKKIDELEASGVETEIVNGKKQFVEKRIYDGREVRFTVLPLWYPSFASMDDVLKSLEMDIAAVKVAKKLQARNRRIRQSWGIEDADEGDGGYVAAHEKVFEKVEEYTANKTKIEELTEALDSIDAPEGKPDGSTVPKQRPAALNVLFTAYPEFEKDFSLLINKRYMAELGDGSVKWLKSKKSLAEYFGYQTAKIVDWKFVEPAFGETGLKHLFSNNGNPYGKKHSRDYGDWLKIKKSLPESK
jgi:hypothetical protein